MKLLIRELQKACLQHIVLPFVYWIFSYQKIDENFVILADSKSDGVPFSLKAMYKELQARNYNILVWCHRYEKLSVVQKLTKSILFMKYYSKAKYVFICDYYLPVSSCNKKEETKVIQLWHASGAFKKFGYDANDDLGSLRFVNPIKNYDLVSVSSECVREIYQRAFRIKEDKVVAFGTSRSDIFFNDEYVKNCEKKFFELYPDAIGKKIILWAPSFRGNGGDAQAKFVKEILKLKNILSEEFYLIIKLHPHLREKCRVDSCSMLTEELYPIVDVLITDYSSVIFDYLIFNSNIIFFVPDYEEYSLRRGLYIDLGEQEVFPRIFDVQSLASTIMHNKVCKINRLKEFKSMYINNNDSGVTRRILGYLESL